MVFIYLYIFFYYILLIIQYKIFYIQYFNEQNISGTLWSIMIEEMIAHNCCFFLSHNQSHRIISYRIIQDECQNMRKSLTSKRIKSVLLTGKIYILFIPILIIQNNFIRNKQFLKLRAQTIKLTDIIVINYRCYAYLLQPTRALYMYT